MLKILRLSLVIAALCLAACATQKSASTMPAANTRTTTVITVAKNGKVTVDRKPVRLQNLVTTLKLMGVTSKSKLAVEGATGADQRDIEQVLEALAGGGLLPKDTID